MWGCTSFGDFKYSASAASWYSCQDAIYTIVAHGGTLQPASTKNSSHGVVTNACYILSHFPVMKWMPEIGRVLLIFIEVNLSLTASHLLYSANMGSTQKKRQSRVLFVISI
jgi:hypothetical protein